MAGLKPTGKMDVETARVMSMPRCGVEDTIGAFMMGSDGKIKHHILATVLNLLRTKW